jgi:membrane fusion protein, multidrug efflux system
MQYSYQATLGVCVAMALLVTACGPPAGFQPKPNAGSTPPAELVLPVEAVEVRRGNIASYFETTSRIEAERNVDVAAKGSARCESLLVEEGDSVREGQVLAELEKSEARAQYAQSEVQVRQNRTAYELAKRQFDEGLGSRIDMENAQYAYEQSVATLESQKLILDNLTIRSPIDGIVTRRELQAGSLVSVGQTVFHIVDPESYMLSIAVPERQLPNLEIGQTAEVTIDALRNRRFDAVVRRINPNVDPASGTIKVVLDFDEAARELLRSSAFARVKLVMAVRENVLLVPKEAFLEESGRRYVFVLRPRPEPVDSARVAEAVDTAPLEKADGRTVQASEKTSAPSEAEYLAEKVEVKTAIEDSRFAQVLFGLAEGDLVVTNGQYTLKDGSPVRVTSVTEALRESEGISAEEALAEARERREAGSASAPRN